MDKNPDDKIWKDLETLILNMSDEDNLIKKSDEDNLIKKSDMDINLTLECGANLNDDNSYYNTSVKTDPEIYYQEIYTIYDNEPDNNTDYTNSNFCIYCKNKMVIPYNEINNFAKIHINVHKKRYVKYLIAVFKLRANLLPYNFVMTNKILRELVYSYLNLPDKFANNINERTESDIKIDYSIYTTYLLKNNRETTTFVYEIYFHQPDLKYEDYLKCSMCKMYLCPMHLYLSNSTFSQCNFCDKKWLVCGWCKPFFNEYYACKYIHKK